MTIVCLIVLFQLQILVLVYIHILGDKISLKFWNLVSNLTLAVWYKTKFGYQIY